MAIRVVLAQLPGTQYAIEPDGVSFGTAGSSLTFATNNGGVVDEQEISKESVTFNVRGVSSEFIQSLRQQRVNNVIGRINGSVSPSDLEIGGYILEKALLAAVTIQRIVTIETTTIIDAQVEYRSTVYT